MQRIGRQIEPYVRDFLLPNFPAVMVTGARAVGKTTSMRAVTTTHLDLSIPAVQSAVEADPDGALTGLARPVLIDEWQEVPEVVGAVKRAVDQDPSPGHFVLTGSVRGPLGTGLWGGTGRLIRVAMFGLSQAEIEGTEVNMIDSALAGPAARAGTVDLDRNAYLDRVVAGGFPVPNQLEPRARALWFRSYLTQLIERDAVAVGGIRQPDKLRAVLAVCAARSGQEQKPESMYIEAGVAKTTLYTHLDLLENLQLLRRLPAWAPSRLRRLARAPKIHLTDSGLAAAMLGVNAAALRLDGPLAGTLMESFVVGELLRAAESSVTPIELFHLRTHDGGEVDIVLVADDGRVVGFEVKAAAKVTGSDARGLRWLRQKAGDRFIAGYVTHTGSLPHRLDDRIWAVPLASLWRRSGSDQA